MKWLFEQINRNESKSKSSVEEYKMKTLNEYLLELPEWIYQESISFLKNEISERNALEMIEFSRSDPDTWWASYHHGWELLLETC